MNSDVEVVESSVAGLGTPCGICSNMESKMVVNIFILLFLSNKAAANLFNL